MKLLTIETIKKEHKCFFSLYYVIPLNQFSLKSTTLFKNRRKQNLFVKFVLSVFVINEFTAII